MAESDKPQPAVTVRDNRMANRFEVDVGGQIAKLEYHRDRDVITLIHTEVPVSLRGRGLAEALARTALEQARMERLRVVPLCPFVQAYLRRHPEFQSLVGDRTSPPGDS